jgi:aminoglycoside 3-N-acetyltransferase
MPPMRPEDLVVQLRALGVRQGAVLVVHTSFKAVGSIADGPLGLIRALRAALGPRGTLVMPAMSDGASLFDPTATPSHGMGVTAELFWRQPGVVRSTHPGASFAAQGPLAEQICAPQPLSPPHGIDSPIGRVHELDGQVLLVGVTHSENTMLHLAEAIACVPYSVSHPCVVEIDGAARSVTVAETDHCCRRFRLAETWLAARGLGRSGKVGRADSHLCNSKDLVAVTVEHLSADPLVFLCPRQEQCGECDRARDSVPGG